MVLLFDLTKNQGFINSFYQKVRFNGVQTLTLKILLRELYELFNFVLIFKKENLRKIIPSIYLFFFYKCRIISTN